MLDNSREQFIALYLDGAWAVRQIAVLEFSE